MPIVLYAILALSGMNILASTLVALAATVLLSVPSLSESVSILGDSVTNQVTLIGFIIVLGAGVGSILRDTGVFAVLLAVLVIGAIITEIGLIFPLIALPILAVSTGLAAGQKPGAWLKSLAQGMRSMLGLFILFWLLAVVFLLINRLAPYDTLLVLLGPRLEEASPFVFAVIVALIGWVGVPGATAAQVVLLDQVFGPLIGQIGLSAASWVVVLLFASKGDTYGPFPNPNMVSAMGMAHSKNLRSMLLTGWILLVPAAGLYTLLLFLETR